MPRTTLPNHLSARSHQIFAAERPPIPSLPVVPPGRPPPCSWLNAVDSCMNELPQTSTSVDLSLTLAQLNPHHRRLSDIICKSPNWTPCNFGSPLHTYRSVTLLVILIFGVWDCSAVTLRRNRWVKNELPSWSTSSTKIEYWSYNSLFDSYSS